MDGEAVSNLKGTEHIITLPQEEQEKIRAVAVVIINELHKDEEEPNLKQKMEEVQEIMSGRLCDLEDNMDWRGILKQDAHCDYIDMQKYIKLDDVREAEEEMEK